MVVVATVTKLVVTMVDGVVVATAEMVGMAEVNARMKMVVPFSYKVFWVWLELYIHTSEQC